MVDMEPSVSLPRCSFENELFTGPPRRFEGSKESAEEEIEIDKSIWETHLPEGVMTNILAHLPLTSLLKFRSVCKKWNDLPISSNFQSIRSKISAPLPICLVDHRLGIMAYDLASGPWTALSDLYESTIYQQTGSFCGSRVVATAGGLILLTEDSHLHGLHIVNPSKTTWKTFHKRVPPMSPDYYIVGMVADPDTMVYNILAAQNTSVTARPQAVELHLYDSRFKSWRMSGTALPEEKLTNFLVQGVVRYRGLIHCLTVGDDRWRTAKWDVFRLEQDGWHRLPRFPAIYSGLKRKRSPVLLFEYRGRLMVAGVDTGPRTSVYIWHHDFEQQAWMLVRRLFEGPIEHFSTYGQPPEGYRMHASGDYLCVCTYPLVSSRVDPKSVFIYNLSNGSWRELPKRLEEKRPEGSVIKHVLYSWKKRAFFFQPKPDALV